MSCVQAIIMAGGKGTRLRSVTGELPKPMVPIEGKPVLEYQIVSLVEGGITEIALVVGWHGQAIRDYFGSGASLGASLSYVEERELLGTAGSLYHFRGRLRESTLLLFGDVLLDVDWRRFIAFHRTKGALATMLVHPNSHPCDSDLVIYDNDDCVRGIASKREPRCGWYRNRVNAGVYVIDPVVAEMVACPCELDFEHDVLAGLIPGNRVFAYRSTEYVHDIGTPERLLAACEDVRKGVPAARKLSRPQACVFVDRDGTLNKLNGHIGSPDELELFPWTAEAVRLLNCSSYLCIVVTNQPVVARGECTLKGLDEVHAKMETELGRAGAYVDAMYFCPHHPDKGFPGEVSSLKRSCLCRKPGIGLIKQAAADFNISLQDSWIIGDTEIDIQTGKNAGLRTVLVGARDALCDSTASTSPTFRAVNVLDAVRRILGNSTKEDM